MNNNAPANLLNTKQHYEILDGLRGIAAISVVVFHFMEIAVPDYEKSFIAHAYLAVDFFFCLSGFVIAYAYDAKLKDIGVGAFFKLRLIRLHPLVIIGSIIGLVAFIFDPFTDLWHKYADKIWWLFGSSCLMIPYPVVPERYLNLFHLNPPTWSLFYEYLANIVYALILIRVRKKLLWVLVLLATGVLFYESHQDESLGWGWGGGQHLIAGTVRVTFSFLAGMLIYRMGWILKSKVGFLGVSVLLMLAFLTPWRKTYNFIVDPLIVAFYFPFIVALGSGAVLHPRFKKFCQFSGNISYPLYMVHYPFIWLFMSYVEKEKPSMLKMGIITGVGTVLLMGLAYIVMVFLDEPIRKVLKNKMRSRRQLVQGTA